MKNHSTFAAIALLCSIAPAQTWASSFVGASYSATCRFPYPLSTYQGCNEYTRAGNEAADCAFDKAYGDCKDENNADCLKISTEFHEVISTEFIGYKACEATVRVHGYRLAN